MLLREVGVRHSRSLRLLTILEPKARAKAKSRARALYKVYNQTQDLEKQPQQQRYIKPIEQSHYGYLQWAITNDIVP